MGYYTLECMLCEWRREGVREDECAEVSLRHERNRHRRQSCVWRRLEGER